MSGAARWLAAACTLAACGDVLADLDVTWPGCITRTTKPSTNNNIIMDLVVVQPGQTNTNVTGLYLLYCNFTTINVHSLMSYPNIKEIIIRDVKFNNETALTFTSFANLEILVLTHNSILGKYLPANSFRNCRRLHAIGFSGNDMSDAPADLLQGLDQLMYLYLTDFKLRKLPSFFTSQVFPHLKGFYLSITEISEFAPTTFANAVNLTDLILSYNKIVNLNTYFITPLIKLQTIELSHNMLRDIPETFFQHKSFLETISLSNNRIESIPLNAFLGTNLRKLYLYNNKLMHLPSNFMSNLVASGRNLDKFYFFGNPWECACLNNLLVRVKKLSIDYGSSQYDGQSPACMIRTIVIQNNNCS